METLDETVGLWVIRRCHDYLDAPMLRQLLENVRRKLGPSVRGDGRRDSEGLNPAVGKSVDDGLGCNVRHRNRHWPSSEAIDGRQQISKSVREWEGNNIHVQMLKSASRNLKCANDRGHVPRDLGLLTRQTLPSPTARVLSDRGPDKFGAHHLTRPFHARMA